MKNMYFKYLLLLTIWILNMYNEVTNDVFS